MRSPEHFLFYGACDDQGQIRLEHSEAKHATKVLRAGPGDELEVTDGCGNLYTCRIEVVKRDTVELSVQSNTFHPRPVREIHLLVGIPERDAFEEVLELAVPLGVAEIVPLECQYCQGKWWQDWKKLQDRFERKLVSALKQSRGLWKPSLLPPVAFSTALTGLPDHIWVADDKGLDARSALTVLPSDAQIACVVGPPGGLSSDELATIRQREIQMVSLSPYRLRTELAASAIAFLASL